MTTLIATTCLTAAEKETATWSPAEQMKTKLISELQLSPDNSSVLFVVSEAEMSDNKNAYVSKIYKGKADGSEAPLPFTTTGSSPKWSPDGEWIAFLSSRDGTNNLYLIRPNGGEAIPLTKGKKEVQTFAWSPDGQKIAFVMLDEKEAEKKRKKTSAAYIYNHDTQVNRLWVIDAAPGKEPKPLTSDEYCLRGNGDFKTSVAEFDWSPDGKKIVFAYSPALGFDYYHLDSSIATVDLETGQVTPWKKQAYFEGMPRYFPDGQSIAYVYSSSPQKYAVNKQVAIRSKEGTHLQILAPTLKTETVSWKGNDGLVIEGLLTYPSGYQEGEQYPLLLVIHGGPMGFFDETFLGTPYPYPLAAFADVGFLVLRPNPRGSTGYGKDFRIGNYKDWGGMDYKDIMAGVDYLIEQGLVNPDKMGVMGWSYGGYMTNWVISQTQRFKAASTGAALSNLVSTSGTTDLPRLLPDYLGDNFQNPDFYQQRSPIHFVQNMATPLLIQHGDQDLRVPISQAYELYHALDRAGKKPLMIVYPGMTHRIMDPKMLQDAMQSNLDWFKEHLSE